MSELEGLCFKGFSLESVKNPEKEISLLIHDAEMLKNSDEEKSYIFFRRAQKLIVSTPLSASSKVIVFFIFNGLSGKLPLVTSSVP